MTEYQKVEYAVGSGVTEYQKVEVVNPLSPATPEQFVGSDLTGSDGGTNRVLTLTNTVTSSGEMVTLDGMVLRLTDDYTVNHLAASSTITFLIPVWNNQKGEVRYYEQA